MTQEQINQYTIGRTFNMNGLSSWSSEELIANDFAAYGKKLGEQEVIFISEKGTNKGASITQLAHWEEEGEILVSSKAEYRVVNTYTKGKRTYIEVEEMQKMGAKDKNDKTSIFNRWEDNTVKFLDKKESKEKKENEKSNKKDT